MCSLTRNNGGFNAPTGSAVTVRVVANTTRLVVPEYNDTVLPVVDNGATFTVVAGAARLFLTLAGPQEDVAIVEVCKGGETPELYSYNDDFHPILGFSVVGI